MASLTGKKIKDTYDGLLKTTDNGALGASAKLITDGLGNSSGVYLGTSGNVGIKTASPNSYYSKDLVVQAGSEGGITIASSNTSNVNYFMFADGTSGASAYIGYIGYSHSDNSMSIATNGTEKMRIDSSGNVGIGDVGSAIDEKLEVEATIRVSASAGGANPAKLKLYARNSNAYGYGIVAQSEIQSLTDGTAFGSNMIFSTNNTSNVLTEAMRIDSSGNITQTASDPAFSIASSNAGGYATLSLKGLGTNGSSVADVWLRGEAEGGGAASAFTVYTRNASGSRIERMRITSGGDLLIGTTGTTDGTTNFGATFYNQGSNRRVLKTATSATVSNNLIEFYNPNGLVGTIATSGSSTAYNTSSDYRLKEDWQPMEGALTRIDALKPVNFAWKADGSRVDGFLAHELAEVIPEAVTGEKDAMRDEEYEVSPAVYEDVVHPAEEAVYETIEHPAIAEELDADGNIIVEAQEAWTEQVLVSEAKEEWTEQVLVSEAVMGTRSVPDYQGIDQSKIVPLLVAAIQELKAEVDALKGA